MEEGLNGIERAQARVIYSYSRQQHYLDRGYKEIVKSANELTSEFLRKLYCDKKINTYKFIKSIERKNHSFNRADKLYFYIL